VSIFQHAFWYLGFSRYEGFRRWVGGRWVKIEDEDFSVFEVWDHFPEDEHTEEAAHRAQLEQRGVRVRAIETWDLG
jgi:hypothetical protein